MSILDNIEVKESGAVERTKKSAAVHDFTDAFNPQQYKYALLIGANEHRNWMPHIADVALKQLFAGYGDVHIQWWAPNVPSCAPLGESAERWHITTFKDDNYVLMFNFYGNPLVQARMIRSLCIILKQMLGYIIEDFIPLIRLYIKCDPTHRGEPERWWAAASQIPEATIKQIASRTATSDTKTHDILHFGNAYFYFNAYSSDYYKKVQDRLERLRPGQMASWFYGE